MKQIQFGYSDLASLQEKLKDISAKCRELGTETVLFHIYSSSNDRSAQEDICNAIRAELPYARFVGCSTNANILDGRHSSADTIISCTIYEDPGTRVETLQFNLEGMSVEALSEFPHMYRKDNPWIKAVELLVSSRCMQESNLTSIFARFKTRVTMFGGGAFSKDHSAPSGVFCDNAGYDDYAVVAVLYGGARLSFTTISVSGWKPLGRSFKITDAVNNVLRTLDDGPAFDIYSKYLNINNDEHFSDNTIEFPLMCRTHDGYEILRDPISCNPDGSITMFSEIDVFESLRLAYGDRRTIIESVRDVAERICDFRPDVIQLFSCVARMSFWGDDIDRETDLFQSIAPSSGFYTSGEILNQGSTLHHFNETLVIVASREGVLEGHERKVLPPPQEEKTVALSSRLAEFVSVATRELEQTNANLDHMITQVEESRAVADAANKAKSDFLANMSHEIRTPINAILGFDTMILRESSDDMIAKYAQNIRTAGQSLLSIINDVLDFSKIESGRMEITPSEYDLNTMINDVMNMMIMKGNDKGLDVRVEVDPGLPSRLFGDDVRIRQILINLLSNAVKYTEYGSVVLKLSGTVDGDRLQLRVDVSDTGIGIREEDIGVLFEKYMRIEDSHNRYVEGSGLGLNITARLLALMDSHLEVASKYGEGSTFGFTITQQIISPEPIGAFDLNLSVDADLSVYTSSFSAPEADVLIVDDNEMNRKVIISLLKQTGIRFDEAEGGYSCLRQTEVKKYDLILLDHMMPDLDGVRTLHMMRDSESNANRFTPIIVMTANAITGAREEYAKAGFDGYISKPVNPDRLEKMLHDYLPADKLFAGPVAVPGLISPDDLPETDGMDNTVALRNLAGTALVIESMKMFTGTATREAGILQSLYETISRRTGRISAADLDAFRIKVHAMKTSAATIGALTLASLAKYLEFAARDGHTDRISAVTPVLLEEWLAFADRLRNTLEKLPQNSAPDSKGAVGKAPDTDILPRLLNELDTTIHLMDIDRSDELMTRIGKLAVNGEIDPDTLEELSTAVMAIDITSVSRLTKALIERLTDDRTT